MFQTGDVHIEYLHLGSEHVEIQQCAGREVLVVGPEALTMLARRAMGDVSFLLRTSFLEELAEGMTNPAASENDRFVMRSLLKNATIAADRVLPLCQDTGTATVFGFRGTDVVSPGDEREALSLGIYEAYRDNNLRLSQLAPLTLFDEENTRTNLPAQIDIESISGGDYRFLFSAKGGGSSNRTSLFVETKALLTENALEAFLTEKINAVGTGGCPPYHLAVVIGGTSPEANLRAVKLAASGWLDGLPDTGSRWGRAFRDRVWEEKIVHIGRETGLGAQYGGGAHILSARLVRLPRHGASVFVGVGVSCNAHRVIAAKINKDGIFLEKLEQRPERFLPGDERGDGTGAVAVDMDQSMDKIRKALHGLPVGSRVALSGTMIVARDIAHARMQKFMDTGNDVPRYMKDHPVYYAGPAKQPKGYPSGSFGPTTSSRMDPYVPGLMGRGASLVMVGKGNRNKTVRDACRQYGGFYLGAVGGAAALIAHEHITSVRTIDFADLGMEAVRKIIVRDLPVFIVFDDQGNSLYDR
ncbi:MAG: fumarate hydratase C-terminal domain-containing protein [Deltaproteobacteria bacterium]|nr:fumarate hydratase C-terminal domain-containing protein [Candidatus Zymogenaceae bacterium]